MKNLFKYLLFLLSFCVIQSASAQEVEMADTMRSEGKIYVVVAIILVVLTGLILYLFLMDRKLTKMEKQFNEKQPTKF